MRSLKFKFLSIITFFFMLAVVPSCKKSSFITSIPDSESTIKHDFVMHIGHAQTEESPRHRSLLLFKEQVESLTEGKVGVEIFSNGIIGDESMMTQAVSEGKLEAVRGGDLEFVPKAMLLGLPMIADSLVDARKLCYSNFVKEMLVDAESRNMKVLAVGDNSGFRQITNSVRPILTPDDMKGLKFRVPQAESTIDFFNEIGVDTAVVPFIELYASLAVGQVNGQENPLATIDSGKLYEVQKYCTIIDYQFFPELMFVNLEWWNSLPADYQKILTSCAKKMMFENARIADSEKDSYIEHIKANGCEVVTLTSDQRAKFFPYAVKVWQKMIDKGLLSESELKQMLKIVGRTHLLKN